MISLNHSNRKAYNWLVYDIGDKYLQRYSNYYKGNLYDLGCGEAPFKEFFLEFSNTYTGIDWTKTLHNSKADIVSDLNKRIELEDEVADTLVSLSVMEHLCEPQIFLNESFRILKPGGYFVLQVPWQWWIHEAPHDYFRYTPYGLKYMFEKAGFEEIEVEATSGFFTTWILKMNYFSLNFIRGTRLMRWSIKGFLQIIWYLSQKTAPYLDKLDKNWQAETQGYFVLARKS